MLVSGMYAVQQFLVSKVQMETIAKDNPKISILDLL